ncbi:hypothetical protein BH10ACI1_BH10ACI1_10040 [soil metagenome]
MAQFASNSRLNSLKGKIWLATSALAVFICVFGLISYLIVSLLTNDPFYAVFIPFLFLAFAVMVFGWWLANEVVHPIEKITLLAKSLERGTKTSLPKTLGSTEADELLHTLQRNDRQIRSIVELMDEVAAGNLNVALTPLQNSDRLTTSFQQLLAKVTESINSRQDLEKLQTAVRQLNDEIAEIKNGKLHLEISTNHTPTKKIAESFNYLLNNFSEIINRINAESKMTKAKADELQKTVSTIIYQDEMRIQELNQAALTLKQTPNGIQQIAESLVASTDSANKSIEKARHGIHSAQSNLAAVNRLRKQIQEAIKQILKLQESSQEIGKIGKSIGDLAQRTNLIALNASIQGNDNLTENERGMPVMVEEIERLRERADRLHRQFSAIEKTISAEISQTENNLQTTFGEAANLSKYAIETSNSLSELEKNTAAFLRLQNNQVLSAQEQSTEAERAFVIFIESIGETEETVIKLKNSSSEITKISNTMENLQLSVTEFETDASQLESSHLNISSKLSALELEEKI